MSQTVLEALWRSLAAALRATRLDRLVAQSNGHRTSHGEPDASTVGDRREATGRCVADGGDGHDAVDDHLRDVPDGAGCMEIWEHLSQHQTVEGDCDD